MILPLLISALLTTPCRANNDPVPTCSLAYGTSIDPDDCNVALQYPLNRILWTRMGFRNKIRDDSESVLDLDWHPLIIHAPAAGTSASSFRPTNATAATSPRPARYRKADPVFLDENIEIASDSGLLAQYRLSRSSPRDDVDHVFHLPLTNVHGSCAIGVDLQSTALPWSWKSPERPLEAFRAIWRVVEDCVGGARTGTAGQGGVATTPRGELRVLVTEPNLLQDLPPNTVRRLEDIVDQRVQMRGWVRSPMGTWMRGYPLGDASGP